MDKGKVNWRNEWHQEVVPDASGNAINSIGFFNFIPFTQS